MQGRKDVHQNGWTVEPRASQEGLGPFGWKGCGDGAIKVPEDAIHAGGTGFEPNLTSEDATSRGAVLRPGYCALCLSRPVARLYLSRPARVCVCHAAAVRACRGYSAAVSPGRG